MKKQNVLNLIKYHIEGNEKAFKEESLNIARYFDSIGDIEISEYILGLVTEANLYSPQDIHFKSNILREVDTKNMAIFNLPEEIADDIKGMINAINRNVGINKFLFEGSPGTGKTEAAKTVSRLLNRYLFIVNFEELIDSKLGQTNKNIINLFNEINKIPYPNKTVILFDEIDAIALDRINSNDLREMGRVTSTIIKELDRLSDLNKEVVIIGTTNLFSNFDRALIRRFDAVINFNRYKKEDLIEIAEEYYLKYIINFKYILKNTKLLKKILNLAKSLPYPGELNNIIKTSLAFSSLDNETDYLRRLYNSLISNLDQKSIDDLHKEGFTLREIEILKCQPKSTISRKMNKDGDHIE